MKNLFNIIRKFFSWLFGKNNQAIEVVPDKPDKVADAVVPDKPDKEVTTERIQNTSVKSKPQHAKHNNRKWTKGRKAQRVYETYVDSLTSYPSEHKKIVSELTKNRGKVRLVRHD